MVHGAMQPWALNVAALLRFRVGQALLAFLLPPFAVLAHTRKFDRDFWVNVLLTLATAGIVRVPCRTHDLHDEIIPFSSLACDSIEHANTSRTCI